ncbi:hypothetical protein [Pseudomonas sp. Marseille-Q5115]|uniref:hypothetical protein n=1 Tax=Pseudomonas sp. Marseille-Q5115 TaxID=2866593 RepID=UPI001CE4931F|nr:hypothetical protein [Pseudomonas sp. Marseille-Q5115]
MKHLMRLLAAVLCTAPLLSGCNTTNGVGHRNPDFSDYQMGRIAIDVQPRNDVSDMVEAQLVDALNRRGVKAYKTSDITRFAKDWPEAAKKIAARGGKELMVVVLGDGRSAAVAGYNASAYTTGNTTYATATPMVANFRDLEANAVIYVPGPNGGDAQVAVQVDAKRHAGGLVFTRDSSMAANIADGIIEGLDTAGAFP